MNALTEFITHTANKVVKAARIHIGDMWDLDNTKASASLPLNYTDTHFEEFKKLINVEYNDGYGGQELFGTIWYTDGTWSTRGEYDGSEWWDYHNCPDIPQDLIIDPSPSIH